MKGRRWRLRLMVVGSRDSKVRFARDSQTTVMILGAGIRVEKVLEIPRFGRFGGVS